MELQSEPKLEAPTRRIDGKTFGKSKDSLKTKSATERFKKQIKKKWWIADNIFTCRTLDYHMIINQKKWTPASLLCINLFNKWLCASRRSWIRAYVCGYHYWASINRFTLTLLLGFTLTLLLGFIIGNPVFLSSDQFQFKNEKMFFFYLKKGQEINVLNIGITVINVVAFFIFLEKLKKFNTHTHTYA